MKTEQQKKKDREYQREYRKKNPNKGRERKLRYHYGLEPEDYQRRLEEQGGVCAICASPCKQYEHLCVDHDHATGAVRGLLCVACNHGLGKFSDSPTRLRQAASYVEQAERHSTKED